MSIGRMPLLFGVLILISLRVLDLDVRPIHHDESVNGWFVDGLFRNGFYNYDPHNYHGPILFYVFALAEKLFGRSVEALRSVTLFFGSLLTVSPLLFRRWIGERAAWIGAFALAVSPAVVFYSRYAIHEIPFALASVLIVYFWMLAREKPFQWKTTVGLGLSVAFAAGLKENFIILIGCLVIAEIMVRVYERNWSLPDRFWYHLSSLLVALVAIGIVFSALGRDEDGVTNFFAAFNVWSHTGTTGNGHEKPFYYWIKIFAELEWAALFGLLLAPLSLKKVNSSFRLLNVLSVGVWLAYSIVSYKTPWCVLSFHWGLILIFAYWVSYFYSKAQYLAIALLSMMAGHSIYQAYQTSYLNVDSDENIYVYGQTYREFMPPIESILLRTKSNPELKKSLKITVVSQYTWPLPYLLGEFRAVGYFNEKNAPAVLDGEYIFIDEQLDHSLSSRVSPGYARAVYRARQWASPMVIYSKKP
jgi:uncharacterized protein (TIGR03663 family)